ncbi:MAG: ribonuclease Z [Bacteroidales bacterium]|jgi:ribonuclease Z|nr:ribonuclease Z [Bacteroidales bacterium]MCI1785064.1 ribonuclease Z [Bacteroidales bacterium]
MKFTLKVMGTASAMPVTGRFQSAQVLDVHGRLFLIDCGEGVQLQMIRYGISPEKIESVFISHIHGDHLFGIFGLLSTMGMKRRTAPLDIFAPSNFGPILKFFLSYYGEGLSFDVRHHVLSMKEPETVFETKTFTISAFPLNHKIETFGFLFREKKPFLDVRKSAVDKYGLTLSEIGALKRGEDVVRRPGKDDKANFFNGFAKCSGTDSTLVIKASETAYLPYVSRSYAYCSDTAPFPRLADWVKGVDILYHETTYLEELSEQAARRHHSTTIQAAGCALKAGAGRLVIGHYSSRCSDPSLYEKECRTVFADTYAAHEGDVFDVPYVKLK